MLIYVVYALFLLIVGVSMRRPIGALNEGRRQRANLERELRALAEAPEDAVARLDHLSPQLARVVEDTRLLRSALEEPVLAARAWLASDRSPLLARVDVGDGSDLDRLDEVDMSLVNARRSVWDWLSAVEALSEADRNTLMQLGLSTASVRAALEGRDAFRRTSAQPRQELARIERMVEPLRAVLARFEDALVRATRRGLYR